MLKCKFVKMTDVRFWKIHTEALEPNGYFVYTSRNI